MTDRGPYLCCGLYRLRTAKTRKDIDMGGFDHGPAEAHGREQESQPTISRNARYGMVLFLVYLLFYGGFVLLTAFNPEAMGRIVWGGVNLAIVYGFTLIIAAVGLAVVYGWLCRNSKIE